MLARAAERNTRHRLSKNAAASLRQFQSPWLASGALASFTQQRNSVTSRAAQTRPNPSRATSSPGDLSRSSSRHLATEASYYSVGEDDIPFDGLLPTHQHQSSSHRNQGPLWSFPSSRSMESSNLIIIPHSQLEDTPIVKRSVYGPSGDLKLLQENLYALVRVGRLDQAASVTRRMGRIYSEEAPELVDAHHRYLTGRLQSLLEDPSREKFAEMQKWFELDIRARGVQPNSGIIATMIKASIAVLEGTRLDRTIRRYVGVADELGPDVKHDTVTSGLFLESEVERILRLFPQEFSAPSEVDSIPASTPGLDATAPPSVDIDPISPWTSRSQPAKIRPVEQKGLGLKALKRSLASMSSAPGDLDSEAAGNGSEYVRQQRLERDAVDSAMERWREEAENTKAMRARGQLADPFLGSYAYEWIQEMAVLLKKEFRPLEDAKESGAKVKLSSKDADLQLLSPFLESVEPEKLCATTVISYIAALTDSKEPTTMERPLVTLVSKIGQDLSKEIKFENVKQRVLEKFQSLPSAERRKKISKLIRRQMPVTKSKAMANVLEDSREASTPFDELSLALRAKLGAMMLSLLIRVAKLPVTKVDADTGEKVTELESVLTHSFQFRSGKKNGVISAHQELVSRLKREPVGTFLAKYLPMIVEPRPWKGIRDGGYLENSLPAVRFNDSSRAQHEYVKMADQRGDMEQTYSALDIVGRVPWKINGPVFEVLTEAWNTGEAIGGLSPEHPEDFMPEKPPEADTEARRRWWMLWRRQQNELSGFHSSRCYQNFQLEVARSYLNESFYCPHNVDFRGRAYPIPPYFNHMGPDYVRGLFLFAKGKPLGENGLSWLKVHVANVYGYDKASLSDREAFAMEHLADIYDSATNPMSGKRWWLTAGSPFQCLAACMELKNALDSPVPSEFVSHLPVQQDGTCNGLQHYAALGGDVLGAQQVNLVPRDRPSDIYGAVAEKVKTEIKEAAAAGHREAQILDGKVTRKVVKQPVMTNVYGVTYHGAILQVEKQLVDVLPRASLDNDINYRKLSAYIAHLIFKALSEMFNGAHAIQVWLGECGGRISAAVTPEQIERLKQRREGTLKVEKKLKHQQIQSQKLASVEEDHRFKSTIVWTTPLGMPVVQPYRSIRYKAIKTNLQDLHVKDSSLADPVSKRKQLQGFPPNFIHSLDATHMMLTALKCDEVGLDFSAVHDSFWTHATDVTSMNQVIRDTFIRMHSEDVIGRLREEFMARYKDCWRYTAIDRRSPLAQRIIALRKSKKVPNAPFFMGSVKNAGQTDELLEETERARLLISDDPEEQQRGKDMVTPCSLYELDEHAAEVTYSSGIPIFGQTEGSLEDGVDDEEAAGGPETVPLADGDDAIKVSVERDVSTNEKITRKKRKARQNLHLWLPLEFPPTPAKGEFDVETTRDSTYFFS